MKLFEIKVREQLFKLDQMIRKLEKGKEPAGTADSALTAHNTDTESHPDMRPQLFPRKELSKEAYKQLKANGQIDGDMYYIVLEDDLEAIVAEAEK